MIMILELLRSIKYNAKCMESVFYGFETLKFKQMKKIEENLNELLEVFDKELELGVTSVVHYLMENKGMTEKQAVEYVEKINEYDDLVQPKLEPIEPINEVDDGSAEIQ